MIRYQTACYSPFMGVGKVLGFRPIPSMPSQKSQMSREKGATRRRRNIHAKENQGVGGMKATKAVGSGKLAVARCAALLKGNTTTSINEIVRTRSRAKLRNGFARNPTTARGYGAESANSRPKLCSSSQSGSTNIVDSAGGGATINTTTTAPLSGQVTPRSIWSADLRSRSSSNIQSVEFPKSNLTTANKTLFRGSFSNTNLFGKPTTPKRVAIERSITEVSTTCLGQPKAVRSLTQQTGGVLGFHGQRTKIPSQETALLRCRDRTATPYPRKPKLGRICKRRSHKPEALSSLVELEKSISQKLYELQSCTHYKPLGNRLVPPLTRARIREIPNGELLLMGPIPM